MFNLKDHFYFSIIWVKQRVYSTWKMMFLLIQFVVNFQFSYYMCDVTPSAPTLHQLLRTISLLGRWSTSGSDRGIAHFFTATRNTIEGVGEKEQTNNTSLGLTQVQKGSYVTLCICRLTLAWIFVKILLRYWNANLSWPDFTHWSGPSLMPTRLSAVRCRLVTRITLHKLFLRVPLSNSLTGLPLPTSGHAEIWSPKPFVWFRAKTVKGIVCLADHLHSVTYVY